MPLSGYRDYERREYCKDIACPVQLLLDRQPPDSDGYQEVRELCINSCIHSTYEFHHWLIEKGFLVVKSESKQE